MPETETATEPKSETATGSASETGTGSAPETGPATEPTSVAKPEAAAPKPQAAETPVSAGAAAANAAAQATAAAQAATAAAAAAAAAPPAEALAAAEAAVAAARAAEAAAAAATAAAAAAARVAGAGAAAAPPPAAAPAPAPVPAHAAVPPGAQPAPAPAGPPAGEDEEEGFFKRLLAARWTVFCFVALALLFALQAKHPSMINGTLKLPFTQAAYEAYGGYSYPRVRDDGQWWRLISTLFVARHGLIAIVFVYLFFDLGPYLEKVLGTVRFAALFLLSGIGGMAVGELYQPVPEAQGPVVCFYALLGAIPGVVLGMTGSPSRVLEHPMARMALFWSVFWIAMGYFLFPMFGAVWNFPSLLGGIFFAILIGAALGLSKQRLGTGLLALAISGGLALGAAGLVVQGKRIVNGKLVDRGKPATGPTPGASPGASPGPTPAPTTKSLERDAAEVKALVQRLRAQAEKVIGRYGDLPFIPERTEGISAAEVVQVRDALSLLEQAVEASNGITTELDDLRIRMNLLLAQHSKAAELAEQWELYAPPARRALSGVAFYAHQEYDRALERFQLLTRSPSLEQRQPELQYYLGATLFKLQRDAESLPHFQRYLELVGPGPYPTWREPFVRQTRAQLR
ncbi:MAG: rhomboid family intramembrane serine protease [Planctomycetota bacterium]